MFERLIRVGVVAIALLGCCATHAQLAARDAFAVPASMRVMRDLVYARYGERELKLDLYFPQDAETNIARPAVIVVRGGGWQAGDKDAFGFIAARLASEGFIAASIEYRTSNEARFPAAVHDVKAAVRWLRANAQQYGVKPDAIGAIGGSAGAHLVTMLATTGGVVHLEGEGGNAPVSSRVQGVVAMACVSNLTLRNSSIAGFLGPEADGALMKAASPLTYVDADSAPLLLLHSPTDRAVPFSQSVEIAQRYQTAKVNAVLHAIDAPDVHAFWNDTRYFPVAMAHAAEFFRRTLK